MFSKHFALAVVFIGREETWLNVGKKQQKEQLNQADPSREINF